MPSQPLIKRQTSLSANLVGFCQYLRRHGFYIGPAEIADALKALEIEGALHDIESFQLVLASILVKQYQQREKFAELFQTYWKELDKAVDSKIKEDPASKPQQKTSKKEAFHALKDWLYGNQAQEEKQQLNTYSKAETFNTRSFTTFSEEEMEDVVRVIKLIAKRLAKKRSRRKQKAKRGASLDVKRTFRLNLRRGGEIMDLAYYEAKPSKWKLVLLCDVSQSMELYSRFLIQFIYAFQSTFINIETFVFSTKITRVTEELKDKKVEQALQGVSAKVTHWSGGTRIGAAFQEFIDDYGRRLVDSKTFLIVLSDGWDVGEVDRLTTAMDYLHRKAHRIIWLNPLMGNPNYKPEVKGMQAALPYIDVLSSAHNLDSLRRLLKHL